LAATLAVGVSCQPAGLPQLAQNGALPPVPASFTGVPLDAFVVEVTNAELVTLIESEATFLLYIGNDYCSSCLAFRPSLIEYIANYKTLVYHYDNIDNSSTYPDLYEAYDAFFPENPPTPSLYFFKQGELRTRQDGIQRMMQYATFAPMMEGYAAVVGIKTLHSVSSLTATLENDDGLFFAYDRQNAAAVAAYIATIFPTMTDTSANMWQIELSLSDELSAHVASLGAPWNGGSPLVYVENGQVVSSLDAATATTSELTAWLAPYL